jgi:hypothetical protein
MQLRYRSSATGVSGSTRMSPGCKDPRTRGSTLELSPSRGRLGFGEICVDRQDHWVSLSSMELLYHDCNQLAHVKCVGSLPNCRTIHSPAIHQQSSKQVEWKYITMRASNTYAMGFMYDIHLNHGCIDGRGIMSYALLAIISQKDIVQKRPTSGVDNQR